jgi:hypothetical protein
MGELMKETGRRPRRAAAVAPPGTDRGEAAAERIREGRRPGASLRKGGSRSGGGERG